MHHNSLARLTALASVALFAAAACGPREANRVDTAAGTVDTAAGAMASTVAVTQIDLGRSVGPDKRVTAPM